MYQAITDRAACGFHNVYLKTINYETMLASAFLISLLKLKILAKKNEIFSLISTNVDLDLS